MQKLVLKVDMYGKTLVVINRPYKQHEFEVYNQTSAKVREHIDSFESFQEALECVTRELYA